MKSKPYDIASAALAPEPTIWALRKNPRAASVKEQVDSAPHLYEHLFGYDPISLLRKDAAPSDGPVTSAENPNLNIINSRTNFVLMEIAADLPADER